jgi:HEAT repeat protein
MKSIFALTLISFLSLSPFAHSQDQAAANQPDTKQRARAARDLAKSGQDGVPSLQRYVTDTDLGVRLEAVKALDEIGGPKTVDALVVAARDNDPEMQIRATDGLVNVYMPGYLKTGISGTLSRVGNSVKAKFTDTNDQVIDAYIEVRPEAITALGRIASGGASLESRANACRALGILRGGAAIPDLVQALHSKDNQTMYEALIALQKIRDISAGPKLAFLLHDLEEKIQLAAIETTGLLGNREAVPDLRDVLDHTHSAKVRRMSVQSLAMLAVPADHALFQKSLTDNDDALRAAGAEGLGRLKDPADRPALDKAFSAEHKLNPRLSMAFALASLGNLDMGEFSPFRYLINTLNLRSYRGVAISFLTELARDQTVRQAIYPLLPRATKDEKIQLGIVLSRSGEKDSLPYLEALQTDPDPEVAQESIRSLRALRARLP